MINAIETNYDISYIVRTAVVICNLFFFSSKFVI